MILHCIQLAHGGCTGIFFTLEMGIRNVTTLHSESGLTRSLATINMADEGGAGKGKDSGCGRQRKVSFLKSHFTPTSVCVCIYMYIYIYIFAQDTCVHIKETNRFGIYRFDLQLPSFAQAGISYKFISCLPT